ncbi:hypothetical protein BDV23DRAFT_173276 [Aspergillus alliaceus]|uniref:Uncharacterized protein n=1 Tax=Petromyces alliaceus TaxID=209559 RepID=A0A5N7C5T4_PETAA|nr:uncharacterized protein BDW43DRAFT_304562 [Aspergillus alliaceus]KAB8227528.1 hypothetical protein BDW43DRAFT_304562 [Aspergillus alliaceus]KAE8389248.1 hypothetical protein BDV23DRAFT_173276 [Aspergillus alliaceus]
MYGIEYDSSGSDHGRVSPMLYNVRVYQIADKFALPQKRAKEKFENIVKVCWQTDDFPTAISEAYKRIYKEDRSLRDIIVRASHEHVLKLLESEDFQTVLEDTDGFAADLLWYLTHNRRAAR